MTIPTAEQRAAECWTNRPITTQPVPMVLHIAAAITAAEEAVWERAYAAAEGWDNLPRYETDVSFPGHAIAAHLRAIRQARAATAGSSPKC